MKYKDWMAKAALVGGTAAKACQQMKITSGVVYRSAGEDKEGTVHAKYMYMLDGLEANQSELYQALQRHRDNKALLALIEELDKHV